MEIKEALRLAMLCEEIGLWQMALEYTNEACDLMQLRKELNV